MKCRVFKGQNLIHLRILHGYALPSLAKVAGIKEHDLWQYENGYKQPSFEHLNTLKRLFNVQAAYFYRDDLITKEHSNININQISFRFLHD